MRNVLFALVVFVLPAAAASASPRFPIENRRVERNAASIQQALRSMSQSDQKASEQQQKVRMPEAVKRVFEKALCQSSVANCQ